MNLREHIAQIHGHLAELETAARKHSNQNFADIVKSAHGKVSALLEHPDLEHVGKHHKAGDEVSAALASTAATTGF